MKQLNRIALFIISVLNVLGSKMQPVFAPVMNRLQPYVSGAVIVTGAILSPIAIIIMLATGAIAGAGYGIMLALQALVAILAIEALVVLAVYGGICLLTGQRWSTWRYLLMVLSMFAVTPFIIGFAILNGLFDILQGLFLSTSIGIRMFPTRAAAYATYKKLHDEARANKHYLMFQTFNEWYKHQQRMAEFQTA